MYHFYYLLSGLNVINVTWYHISLIAVHIVILKPFIKLKEKNTIATVISESKEENKVNWKLTLTIFCDNKHWKWLNWENNFEFHRKYVIKVEASTKVEKKTYYLPYPLQKI